jgi:hypothetical protein
LPQTTTARQDPIAAVPIDFPLGGMRAKDKRLSKTLDPWLIMRDETGSTLGKTRPKE